MTKSTDEVVEQVLAGLRDSEVPVGMERRILEAVQDRAAMKSRSRWQWLRPMSLMQSPTRWSAARSSTQSWTRSWTWGIALAGTVAICVAGFMVNRMKPVSDASQAHAIPVKAFDAPPTLSSQVAEKSPQLSAPSIVRVERKAPARKARLISVTDATSLREMHAASYPAPPAPLTQEEKLLLRIAHKGDPQELALLNPVMRAARDAEEKAEVERFFTQPATGDNE
jgi:hypothetical protein